MIGQFATPTIVLHFLISKQLTRSRCFISCYGFVDSVNNLILRDRHMRIFACFIHMICFSSALNNMFIHTICITRGEQRSKTSWKERVTRKLHSLLFHGFNFLARCGESTKQQSLWNLRKRDRGWWSLSDREPQMDRGTVFEYAEL